MNNKQILYEKISAIVSDVINEERGVFSEIQDMAYNLAKEFILKSKFRNLYKHKSVYYYSKYKVFGYKVIIESDSYNHFAIEDGIMHIGICISFSMVKTNQGKSKERNDVLATMCHEFTHLLQTIYSKLKTEEKNKSFVIGYNQPFLYMFCYSEMQARIAEIFGYDSESLNDENNRINNEIKRMRNIIEQIKNENNIYEFMYKISQDAKKGFVTYLKDGKTKEDNNFPYLQNVTKENYMKKYRILIDDLEKRMKWYVSRVYYWVNKLKNENPSLLRRNDSFDDDMERNINRAEKISKTKQRKKQEKEERLKQYYIANFILNPRSKIIDSKKDGRFYYTVIQNGKEKVNSIIYYNFEGNIENSVTVNDLYISNLSEYAKNALHKKLCDYYQK